MTQDDAIDRILRSEIEQTEKAIMTLYNLIESREITTLGELITVLGDNKLTKKIAKGKVNSISYNDAVACTAKIICHFKYYG